jgi:hypothetical protein
VLDALLLAVVLAGWGAQAVVPWRLARLDRDAGPRRLWGYAALPLLLAAGMAALLAVRRYPDAALAAGLFPLTAATPGRLLAVLFPSLFAVAAVTALGRTRLEAAAWRIAAACGLLFLAAACLAGELLRTGEGPTSPPAALLAAAACRLLVALAAGELLAPGRPLLALLGGGALALYPFALPPELAHALWRGGHGFTLAAAALLLGGARWLPARLRRPAEAGGILLAALFLVQAAALSQELATQPMPPLPPLPPP